MHAIILAAGRGVRMGELTQNTPKPLLQIAGKTLIEWQIERLRAAGIFDIVINLHYLGEQIQNLLGDGKQHGVRISYSREEQLLETAGGIKKALNLLGEEPFCLINADIWLDLDIAKFLRNYRREYWAYLLLVETPDWKKSGDFDMSGDKIISGNTYTFAGLSILHPRLFADLAPDTPCKLAPLLNRIAAQGLLGGELFHGDWQDIGTPERLRQLQKRYDAI